jgi:hypothetical protein
MKERVKWSLNHGKVTKIEFSTDLSCIKFYIWNDFATHQVIALSFEDGKELLSGKMLTLTQVTNIVNHHE